MQTAQRFYTSKPTSCQISFLKCENKVLYSNTVSGASESRLRAAYARSRPAATAASAVGPREKCFLIVTKPRYFIYQAR